MVLDEFWDKLVALLIFGLIIFVLWFFIFAIPQWIKEDKESDERYVELKLKEELTTQEKKEFELLKLKIERDNIDRRNNHTVFTYGLGGNSCAHRYY